MSKKISVLAVLTLALLGAGCEDPCERGLELRNDVTNYSATVASLTGQATDLSTTCATVSPWQPKLTGHSNFARRVAHEHFQSVESRCVSWGYERRCWNERYRDGRRYVRCENYSVCRMYERIPHRRDGFDQANELASLLSGVKTDLTGACTAAQNGQTEQAREHLGHAQIKLTGSIHHADYVLTRAGCYDRRGD